MRGAMLIETVLLGVGSSKLQIESLPAFWHFNFYDAPGVAEQLIEGKQPTMEPKASKIRSAHRSPS